MIRLLASFCLLTVALFGFAFPLWADSNHATSDQLAADAAALAPAFIAPVPAPADPAGKGAWGAVIPWTPHIPVTAACLPDGHLLTFSSNQRTTYPIHVEYTYAAVWDPATGIFTEVNNPRHDMFCGGAVTLPDGRVVVSGGRNTTPLTSVFDYRTSSWSALPNMNDPRWYNTSVALPDGNVVTISGSGGANTAERWDAASGWRRLPGIDWSAVTSQPGYINVWSPLLFLAPGGRIFHFGPTKQMNWVDVNNLGALIPAGQTIPGTQYPKEGAWAMYEEGKILVSGGGGTTTPNPKDINTGTSTTAAYTIDLNGGTPAVKSASSMEFPRQFANTVILPSGEIMVIGGNSGQKFSDAGSILTPELWNPRTGAWRRLADMTVPRNYHSVALLLPDGRVWSGGGGLAGNSADHRDAQIFTPPALLNSDGSAATRPTLDTAPSKIGLDSNFTITGTAGLAKFAFIKMSAITHSVNTDLRYLELSFTETSAGHYSLLSKNNYNVMTPGYWMLFGIAPNGTYSVSKTIQVSTDDAPFLTAIADQFTPQGTAVNLQIPASTPANGIASYTATGLPPGLSIAARSGLITGTPTQSGSYQVGITVTSTAGPAASQSFVWNITLPVLARGSILREWWTGISGWNVENLTSNTAYPTQPTGIEPLSSFETPSDSGDNYGQRVRGFVYPPTTGSYRFWIAGDDESQLFLSTDANPLNATLIARTPYYSQSREWTKFTEQVSPLITLVAGRRYYIEARMKESDGSDNLAVAWQKPGNTGPTIIPGNSLSPYQPYLNPQMAWSLDEKNWSGTTGEVRESAGLYPNFSGTSRGGATTSISAADQVLGGNPGTGRSGRFGGNSQYIEVPALAALQAPEFTISAWAKMDQGASGAWRCVVSARELLNKEIHGFYLGASPDGRWVAATGGVWSRTYGPSIVAGKWTHLSATFRASSVKNGTATGLRTLFINGVAVAQDNAAYTPVTPTGNQLYIGASSTYWAPGGATDFAVGNIDEIRLHAAPLSQNDIVQTMNLRHSFNQLPFIPAKGNQNNVLGANVALNLGATDADNDPLTYSATGLPPGLTLSATGGVITGTPSTLGTYPVVIQVSDGNGTIMAGFTWTIRRALTVQPLQGAIAPAGGTLPLNAVPVGGINPRYSWSFGDGTPDTAWSTSPGTTHTFTYPGRFIVTLTAQDSDGRVVTASFYQGISAPLTARRPTASSGIAYETRTSGNPRIWVVNPDSDSVTAFDSLTGEKLAETAVAASPRCVAVAPDGRIWVVSADTAAISILNSSTYAVVQTLPLARGTRPYGLAFDPAGSAAWLTLENAGLVLKLNPSTGAQLGSVGTGTGVRHLSVSADSTRVYVSRFITPPLIRENTAAIDTSKQGGQILVLDATKLTIQRTLLLQHSEEYDTSISGRGIPNYLGAPVISPDGKSAWVPSIQDNIKRGKLRDGQNLTHENTIRAIFSRLDLAQQTEAINSRVDFDNAGVPSAACIDPSGIYAFVALEASRSIAVVDLWNAVEVVRFPAGRAPQSLVLAPDGKTLFVENFMDRTIGVYDVSAILSGGELPAPNLGTLNSVAKEKLLPNILRGKQLFYDAKDNRLALQEYISCAACHNDGGQDGRVWDFTGFGEGLRNTITLRGHGGTAQGPLHWSANFNEVQDFESQIHQLAGGLGLIPNATANPPLGTPNAGRSADLDALAAYVQSLTVNGASPNRSSATTLSASATAGRTVFAAKNCGSCHSGTQMTNSAPNLLTNIGTIKPASGTRLGGPLTGIDVPTLRGLWASAPYLHDGSARTIGDAIRAHRGNTVKGTDLTNLVAFLNNLDDDAAGIKQFGDAGFESPKIKSGSVTNPLGCVWKFSPNSGVTTNDSDLTNANSAATEGAQVLFLRSNGSAEQAVALSTGTYKIRFAAAQRGAGNTDAQTIIISINGKELARIKPSGASYGTYETPAFTVPAGPCVIRFAGLGTNSKGIIINTTTAFIDNLRFIQ